MLADACSSCPFLNVATVSGPLDLDTARSVAEFFPAGRPFVLATPHRTADLGSSGLTLVGRPPYLVRPAGDAAPARPEGVTVTEVRLPAELPAWDEVLARGYPMPQSRPRPPCWAATLAEPGLPAVLVASDDGIGVYRRMGHLPVTRWTMWFRG